MSDNEKKYITEIDEYKNDMLESSKELVVDYEKSREIHEKIIEEYESPSNTRAILGCSQIVAYVDDLQKINWKIELLDGTVLYKSGTFSNLGTFIFDLATLNLELGTQFKLVAYVQDYKDVYSSDFLEYRPSSATVYYKINDENEVQYIYTVVSPLSPPVLECESLSVHNNAVVLTKYQIRLADTGKTIYTSDRYDLSKTWTYNMGNLGIAPGTKLKLHAGVIGGSDSEPYLIISYNPKVPSSVATAHFTLAGTTIDTTMFFDGAIPG